MGRDWEQRHVPAGDVGADGLAEGFEGLWVGTEFGTADDDQVWSGQHSGVIGT